MPSLDDLAAQTIGEQEWRILRLEDENARLRAHVQALGEQSISGYRPDLQRDDPPRAEAARSL